MLENARRGSCQQVRVKFEIKEEEYAECSEESGRRKGGVMENLKTNMRV